METRIARADFEDDRRVIAISNIHGYLGFLKRILEKANYSPYKDILVINGNMIEKGPHSLQTLRYISQLSDDGDVYLVMGNAEAIQLLFLADDTPVGDDKIFRYIVSRRITGRSCLLSEMFYEMNVPIESARDIQRYKAELKKRYMPEIMFLNSMPTILETKNLIFVHGGIPNEDLENFEKVDAMQFLKRDAYLEHCKYEFSKYVITGGWPSHLYSSKIQSQKPIIDRARKIVSIAGGAGYKFDGQVNALIINDAAKGNFGYVYEDGFQEAIALSPQKASTDSINIRKTSNFVKILEPGAEFSYILHRASGKKLYIYNRYLHSDDEFTTCEDYTDYQLEVRQGDRLSVLFETSKGYLVKKNGVTGWYQGEIELLPREEIITRDELLSMHQGTQIIVEDASLKYNENLKYEQVTEETSVDPEIDIPLDIVTKPKQEETNVQEEKIVPSEITIVKDSDTETQVLDDEENNISLDNNEIPDQEETQDDEDITLTNDDGTEIQEETDSLDEETVTLDEEVINETETSQDENDDLVEETDSLEDDTISDDESTTEESDNDDSSENENEELEESDVDETLTEESDVELSDEENIQTDNSNEIENQDSSIENDSAEEDDNSNENSETVSKTEKELKKQERENYNNKILNDIINIYQNEIEKNKGNPSQNVDNSTENKNKSGLTEQIKKYNYDLENAQNNNYNNYYNKKKKKKKKNRNR